MIFWAIGVLMAIAVGLAVMLGGRGAAASRRDGAMAIFKDQMAELERDRARGLITEAEAEGAKAEIGRRMLAASREDAAGPQGAARGGVIVAAGLVPVIGLGLYLLTGSPGARSMPFAERQQEVGRSQEVADLAAELRQRLLEQPDGGPTDGWLLLARTLSRQGDWAAAAEALGQISRRPGVPPGIMTRQAEALVTAAGGIVTPEAMALIDEALARDPTLPAGAFYKAVAADQAGDPQRARAILIERMEAATGSEPWLDVFAAEATRLDPSRPVAASDFARGPTARQVEDAAGMGAADRQNMIRSMVEGLEARLAEDPADADGWLRLARARIVLGEPEAALAAARGAVAATSDLGPEDARRIRALGLLDELGGG